ncbi:MAG: TonB family protein [Nitrospirota bacterium]
MSLRRFLVYSVTLHTLFLIVLFLTLPVRTDRGISDSFFTRLIAPDELLDRKPPPGVKPAPESRPAEISQSLPAQERSDRTGRQEEVAEGLPEEIAQDQRGLQPSHSDLPPVLPRSPQNLRDKLFDRSVIGDIAKRERQKDKTSRTFSFDAKDYKFLIYNRRLKEKIESIWIYPPEAAEKGIYGDLLIKFSIKKNGRLGEVELLRTSGYRNLDDAAMKALIDAEPYWPLPDEWGMNTYTIVGHFVYTIYGYYVR